MPLAALRLVNPPRRRRRKTTARKARAGTVRRIRTKNGTRYLKKVGGRWQFTKAPRKKTARRKTTKRRNPAKKTTRRKTTARKPATRRKVTARRKNPTSSAKRRAAAKKAAATRKRNAAKRSAAAKKAARTRKRRTTVARKRRSTSTRRRRRNPARKRRVSMATRRKISRALKRRYRGKANPTRRKRRAAPKRKRRTRRTRRNPWTVTKHGKSNTLRHTRRRKRKYRLLATRKGRFSPRIRRKNPVNTLKKVLPIYGGFLAIRVLHGLFRSKINPMLKLDPKTEEKYGPFIPAGVLFLASALLAPKVFKRQPKIVEGLQLGSAFALLNTVVKQLVVPMLPTKKSGTMQTIASALSGYDDVGVMGYGGYGAYISDPTGYSLPPPPATAEPGVGLDVHEAMALDEYVADNGMGFDVNEVLAGTEIDYMQRGGAGGSLSKTVFSDA